MQCSSCRSRDMQVIYREGVIICRACAVVQNAHLFDLTAYCDHRSFEGERKWRRAFHFSERMAQMGGREPEICDRDWDIILDARDARREEHGEPATRKDVVGLLKSIVNEPSHNIVATRWLHYQGEFTRRRFTIYGEKWQTILEDLGKGYARPHLSAELQEQLCAMFCSMQAPFETVRHTRRCSKKPNCHRTSGCRHNFYNYDGTIRTLLLLLDQAGTFPAARRHLTTFPPLQGARGRTFERDMRKLIAACGWDWVQPEWRVV